MSYYVWNDRTQIAILKQIKKNNILKFIYSEKATKLFEIFTLLLTVCTVVKSKVKISQNCVAFSKYMNFTAIFFCFFSSQSNFLIMYCIFF